MTPAKDDRGTRVTYHPKAGERNYLHSSVTTSAIPIGTSGTDVTIIISYCLKADLRQHLGAGSC